MQVTKFSVARPVTTAMLFLGLLLFGFMAYLKMPINIMPEINLPAMVIYTQYPGATPGEVETEVTNLLEKELATINGLKLIQSYSMPNTSMIITQFEMDKNQDKAMAELRNKIDLVVSLLPKDAKLPYVRKRSRPILAPFNLNGGSVVDLILTGNINEGELYQIARKKIKDRISRIEGVTKIEFDGGKLREVQIQTNKEAIHDLGINLTDVAMQLQNRNVDMSGGSYTSQYRENVIKTGKKYGSILEIESTEINTPFGPKRISDFANVKDTFANLKTDAFFYNGQSKQAIDNIVGIGVLKSSSANAVAIAKEVKKLVPEIQKTLPPGVVLSLPFDSSEYIESSVNDALINVILGIIITGLILFLFVNNIRATLIVSISIPVSLIVNFMAMSFFNGSLNMMSLMSFSVAIGALVSNSIVVLENIIRLKSEGMPLNQACVQGTQEVFTAILASTGTNLVVFLPVASMNSMTGAFFTEYALTISFATILSLLVSISLTPMLASLLLKNNPKPSRLSNLMISAFDKLANLYEKSLNRLMAKRRYPVMLFASMFSLFMITLTLIPSIGFEFEPASDNGDLYVELEMATGTSLERNKQLTKQVETILSERPEVVAVLSTVGSKNSFTTGSNYTNISVKLSKPKYRSLSNKELSEVLLARLEQIPEIKPMVGIKSSEEGSELGFLLKSDNSAELAKANEQVSQIMNNVKGIIGFESTLRNGPPLIQFEPNHHILIEAGITVNELALAVRSAVNGIKATVLSENDVESDIKIQLPPNEVKSLASIEQLPVHTPNGVFTVSQLAKVSFKTAPAQILHKEKVKIAEFSATPAPNAILGNIRSEIDAKMALVTLPPSVEFKWAGTVEELEDTMVDMTITFSLAIVLMFMLLASLMESLWLPLVIFTTVPMALIGVLVIMYLGGTTFNIMSIMAIITLLGLVVNDDILIHDYTEQLIKKHQLSLKEATIKSGKTKMKAVIMTTVAIIFGMLPNAIGLGDAGAEFRTPMAIVTIGGMITSTVLTLYLIPSLFYAIKTRKTNK